MKYNTGFTDRELNEVVSRVFERYPNQVESAKGRPQSLSFRKKIVVTLQYLRTNEVDSRALDMGDRTGIQTVYPR